MPLFDLVCQESCGWERDDVYVANRAELPKCSKCGADAMRLWKTFSGANVIGDDIPGGFVQENFGHKPETFYSWSAMRKRAKELGLEPFVRHQPPKDSDKSKATTRWV